MSRTKTKWATRTENGTLVCRNERRKKHEKRAYGRTPTDNPPNERKTKTKPHNKIQCRQPRLYVQCKIMAGKGGTEHMSFYRVSYIERHEIHMHKIFSSCKHNPTIVHETNLRYFSIDSLLQCTFVLR